MTDWVVSLHPWNLALSSILINKALLGSVDCGQGPCGGCQQHGSTDHWTQLGGQAGS